VPHLALVQLAAEAGKKKQFWILDPLYTALGHTLAWFYAFVGDYGLSIVLLTFAVRVLLIPLTIKQIRSMQAMQRLQPEIKRLQQKYKDDRQKLNEETMKFYRENKVNPLSGCLPLLLQMPLFIVLYRLISDLVPKSTSGAAVGRCIESTGAGCPKHIPKGSQLFEALVSEAGTMKAWGMDLAEKVTDVSGFGKAWPYYLLIGFVVATGWYQQRQTMARQARDGGAVNQQMQMMGKIFPIFFGFISLTIPAGVVVYFAASNLWQIGQQAIMFRNEPAAGAGPKGGGGGGTKPAKPPTDPGPKGGDGGPPAKPATKPKPQPKPRPASGRAQPPGGNGARSRSRSKGKRRR
jgi:YidC/Oxa1 family membrane protein insertase